MEGGVDVVWGVGGADEGGFELGGWPVDALIEKAVEGGGVAGGVAGESGLEVGDGVGGEEEGEHGADAVEGEGEVAVGEDGADAVLELGADGFEVLIDGAIGEELALGEAGDHGEGVAGEGAGLVDGAGGGKGVHDFGAAAEGADGEATADDFAEEGEVGMDAGEFLDAAEGEAEAGHDFVEDEEGAVGVGEVAELLEESGCGEDEAGVGGVGFEDDGGDLVGELGKGSFDEIDAVEGEGDGEGGEGLGDAGAIGLAEGEGSTAGFDEEGVDMAVVAACEFDDFGASCVAASKADGGEGGFGAAVGEADFFDPGEVVGDPFGDFDFVGVGDAVGGAVGEGIGDGLDDGGVGVAEDHGSPGADVVDEGAAVYGVDAGALGGADEEGSAADGFEGADGGVDAAGDDAECALEEGLGLVLWRLVEGGNG